VLVSRAIAWARERGGELRAADVGTGSGCIAVALAHYLPQARVWASDDDPAALEVASRNVATHGLTERVTVVHGDLLAPLPAELDLICANLPYLDPGDELPREVLAQPRHALFAEERGAALVRRLLREAPSRLAPGGLVLLELDPNVAGMLDAELPAYAGHRLHRDLQGQVRVLEAWTAAGDRNA
jgi:release factor glutamine methyltransferase